MELNLNFWRLTLWFWNAMINYSPTNRIRRIVWRDLDISDKPKLFYIILQVTLKLCNKLTSMITRRYSYRESYEIDLEANTSEYEKIKESCSLTVFSYTLCNLETQAYWIPEINGNI